MKPTPKSAGLLAGLALCFATLATPGAASASKIIIQFTGLDITYDGATIRDTGSPSDPLSSVVITNDGADVAGSPFTTGAAIDVTIPGVVNIPTAGGSSESGAVSSLSGGSLKLALPGGGYLNLTLDSVMVNYLNLGQVQFAFGATVAGVDGQQLPAGLELGSPATLSFSATIGLQTSSSNGRVSTFRATGSGEIVGDQIPEPTTAGLGLLGLMLGTMGLLRYRFG
ncbi:MAG: hypothetical protein ACRCT8_13150 [Lacipirellulaceae bacterium]